MSRRYPTRRHHRGHLITSAICPAARLRWRRRDALAQSCPLTEEHRRER
jgi:hypothetical protein